MNNCCICQRELQPIEKFLVFKGKTICSECSAIISKYSDFAKVGATGEGTGKLREQVHMDFGEMWCSLDDEVEKSDLAVDETEEGVKISDFAPRKIYNELSKRIVGQHDAKVRLSVAAYEHMQRISGLYTGEKSNVLLVGPTGCGKTYLVENLARILNVPFVIADANSLTESGYVGEDVDSLVKKLFMKSGGDRELTEKGIIFIDEFDKLCKEAPLTSRGVGVGTMGVQQQLLKIVENSSVNVAPKTSLREIYVSTKNILFICGGAFVGLEDMVRKKKAPKKSMGFGGNISQEQFEVSDYSMEDLVSYGVIPEMAGRLPILTTLEPLTEEVLEKIFCEPEESLLHQYEQRFMADGVELVLEHDVLTYIAKKALALQLGARGLRSVAEEIFARYLFELPSSDAVRLTFTMEDGELHSSVLTAKEIAC